ncbi:ABC transporter ATP-binding protein [Arundinibacter roseus]|uniref:ATP-binding cassette domain-containing protein n=1 Tax=Arundinibacter roseus TaxID=2070510 RepID=A0A4R4K396_9BACT|nr:ATP-binding cassette domain-containing protein [Arundinibacter roseus]TDB61857.1 ATP-binding cassette domain-containing protein [Arundinibacter roseus]
MKLALTALNKSYGSHAVLAIDTWQIPAGIFWIQGENGAGKSTLFRILAGMLPFEGTVVLDDSIDQKKQPILYRLRVNIGEAEPLYPSFLTPADLLHFVAEAKKSPPGQLEELVQALGINFLSQPLGACSSGMVKKTSLALAFLGQPGLIILDEPLITIDQEARSALFLLIKKYHSRGVSFLLSSHQPFDPADLPLSGGFLLQNRTLVPLPV